jgi:hypothetical protein
MAKLRFTRVPERGDICLGNLTTKQVLFAKADSVEALADIDQSKYEINGVVAARDGNDVLIVFKENASKTWAERYQFSLSVTEGTTAGKLAVNDASNWAAYTVYTIPITEFENTAEGKATLVSELNAFFQDTDNPVFQTQDWVAELAEDGTVNINFAYTDYRQASVTYKPSDTAVNRGSDGFTIAANAMPDIPFLANVLRKNGYAGADGAISSMTKALAYFRSDLNNATYNPTSNVASIKRNYPICLPGYLGTSQYSGGDRCALLRSVYGDGEQGWLKFMKSCLPVYPTEWGLMGWGDDIASELTKALAAKRYSSQKKTNEPMCKAACYCDDKATLSLPKGKWHLPSLEQIAQILDGVQYNVVNNRNADVLNKSLNKINGSAVSCSSLLWSAFRVSANLAWFANGNVGFFNGGNFYVSYVAVPVSLFKLA